jgi:hypothetical protein
MLIRYLLVALLAGLPGFAFAHGGLVGPHGGDVEDATPGPSLHFEMVVTGSTVSVYLSDEDGKSIPVAGSTGMATVLVNKKKELVKLEPAGDNLLKGTGSFAVAADIRMLVLVNIGGTKQQALFSRAAP